MSSGRSPSAPLVVLVAAGALAALLGIPKAFRPRGPEGPLEGLVVDQRGFGVPRTAIYLFDEALQLAERTLTDEDGHFALQHVPLQHHVLVWPEPERDLAPRWHLDGTIGPSRLDFVLPPTRWTEVAVRDAEGQPIPGAEVRVYERDFEAAVLARVETDGRGLARVALPPRADLAVRIPGPVAHWIWRFDVRATGERISLALGSTCTVRGTLRANQTPAAGLWIQAGPVADAGWFGFVQSDEHGAFALEVPSAAPVELLVVDPRHDTLPQRIVLTGPSPLEVDLAPGQPLEVSVDCHRTDPLVRVWAWDASAQAWNWGQVTDAQGTAAIRVGRRFGVHIEPRAAGHEGLTLWDLDYRSPYLHLDADSGSP